ncbi:MAG: hypothetical protein HZC28_15745 [Spirochaetes bacterium]|nr:hypothetical protein [Spirochaetota bacterium]
MKKYIILAVFIAASSVFGITNGVQLGVTAYPGILFDNKFDPGYSGTSFDAAYTIAVDVWRFEAGLSFAQSPIGWQVMLPLRAGIAVGISPAFGSEFFLEGAPGAALSRPLLAMYAFGAEARFVWHALPRFDVIAALGVRYTACPLYNGSTGVSYAVLDVPAGMSVRFGW